MGVVLGIYLFRAGFSSFRIGLIIAAGLAGSAGATILVSFVGDRLGRSRCLVLLSLLSALGGLALASYPSFPLLLILAFAFSASIRTVPINVTRVWMYAAAIPWPAS